MSTRFRDAVSAIDAGDVVGLQRLLDAEPGLATAQLDGTEAWAREMFGTMLDGYFRRPCLLWFVAENPTRTGHSPANIAEIARVLIEAARRAEVSDLDARLDGALGLVISGRVPRESGVQIGLIDALIDAGAKPGNGLSALGAKNIQGARRLIERGGPVTLASAVCLDLAEPAGSADDDFRHALVAAALCGKADALRKLLARGADPNSSSSVIHPHGTALHHAVDSGSLEAVRVLVEAGADPTRRDARHDGTPLDWAEYLRRSEIVDYLRSRTP